MGGCPRTSRAVEESENLEYDEKSDRKVEYAGKKPGTFGKPRYLTGKSSAVSFDHMT
jgi:hypothetical protein